MRSLLCVALLAPWLIVHAQPTRTTLRGVVRAGGQPVDQANVFVLGTLDGTLTDSLGRFQFTTSHAPAYTLVIRRGGFREQRRVLEAPVPDTLAFALEAEGQRLAPVSVQAGRYVAADEPGAVLTPLEIVSIPGTAANVNRAIQTLPGVQQVDEGTGLFVRGGDYLETRVFLNDGLLLTPAQLQSPSGTFIGTIDPFLLEGIFFTSGGFGARYGDALSAVTALRTQGRPAVHAISFSAGLAAVGVNAAVVGPRGTGARLVAAQHDLAPVVRLNGSPRAFSVPPRGRDLSASAYWDYRPTGRLALFTTTQASRVGMENATPSLTDTYATNRHDDATVIRWSDVLGRVGASVVASRSGLHGEDAFGAFQLDARAKLAQLSTALETALTPALTLRGGGEHTRHDAALSGSIPASGDDQRPGARVRLYDLREGATRAALWSELDWRVSDRGRLILGARRDDATNARHATMDPRLSAAMRVTPRVSVTAALGIYHQVVDPLLQGLGSGATTPLPSMQARHAVLGVQVGDSTPMLRIEAYDKRYQALAGQTRAYRTVGNGTGRAYGIDVLAHAPSVAGVSTRLVYSFVRSRRTDPSTGIMAPAPADITHGVALIATRGFANGVSLGSAFRYASGRPFTPVTNAVPDAGGVTWTPTYGPPGSDRLPAFARLDLSLSGFRRVRSGVQVVGYTAITNALGRPNVFTRRYNPDYTSHHDVRSTFNRSLYFGGVLTLLDN